MKPSNKLKIDSLTHKWADKDIVLLHANFQILKDFVEDEVIEGIVDWKHNDEIIAIKKEIDILYNWWNKRLEKAKDIEFDPIWVKEIYEEDTSMLIRLIKIRGYLWT